MCFKSTEKKYIKKYIRSKNPADRFWFSYNFDTTESQNGSGWRGPLGFACPKSALLEPRAELFPLPPAQDPELTISWPLQPELPWIFSLGSAEPLCWFLCHLRRNLSPIHSRSLLDCSCPAELPLQQGSGWFKSPTRSRACKSANSNLRLLLCVEGLILFFSH